MGVLQLYIRRIVFIGDRGRVEVKLIACFFIVDINLAGVFTFIVFQLKMIPIVISGSIKISREDNEGNELLLYYIEGGDTCAMTLQCCTSKSNSQIKATSMEPSVLFMFPAEMMEYWMDKYKSWREYIISSYHVRLMEIMETVDAIAFMKLDERLLKYLNDQAKLLGSLEIHHTHQQIADDLHSSRVVISRLLKQLENKGVIELHRNKIILQVF
jgi:CRP/FNR family transcriptional regulator